MHQQLLEAKADVLWCGISTPKQERFMAKYIGRLPVRLMVGVGAAFDLNAGLLKDSPQWVQKCGLQWAHRLCQEPRRLWRRYLLNIPRFIWLYALQRMGMRSFELPHRDPVLSPLGAMVTASAGEGQAGQNFNSLGDIAA